jgi:hypothetical protein
LGSSYSHFPSPLASWKHFSADPLLVLRVGALATLLAQVSPLNGSTLRTKRAHGHNCDPYGLYRSYDASHIAAKGAAWGGNPSPSRRPSSSDCPQLKWLLHLVEAKAETQNCNGGATWPPLALFPHHNEQQVVREEERHVLIRPAFPELVKVSSRSSGLSVLGCDTHRWYRLEGSSLQLFAENGGQLVRREARGQPRR